MNFKEELLKKINDNKGYVSTKEVKAMSINRFYLSALEKEGQIERIKRGTLLEKYPVIFREDFYNNKEKQTQWKYFIKKINIENIDFEEVIYNLKIFLGYITDNILENKNLEKNWNYKTQNWE